MPSLNSTVRVTKVVGFKKDETYYNSDEYYYLPLLLILLLLTLTILRQSSPRGVSKYRKYIIIDTCGLWSVVLTTTGQWKEEYRSVIERISQTFLFCSCLAGILVIIVWIIVDSNIHTQILRDLFPGQDYLHEQS